MRKIYEVGHNVAQGCYVLATIVVIVGALLALNGAGITYMPLIVGAAGSLALAGLFIQILSYIGADVYHIAYPDDEAENKEEKSE